MENLKRKEFNPEPFVSKVIDDPRVLKQLMNNLLIKDDTVRYNSHKVLLLVSESNPEVLYPKWDFFVDLLKNKNNFHKVIGIQILTNLTKVDIKNKFENIFNLFIDLLDAKSVMTASHVALNLGKIAKNRPNLRKKITAVLINIDKTNHVTSRKELIKASVIKAIKEYFDEIKNKDEIISFVNAQLSSSSPKTRKIAEKFLIIKNY